MAAPTIITITNGTVKLGLTADPTVDYKCQVVNANITASPNLNTVPATFCSPQSEVPASTSYTLNIEGLQDWTVAAGLSHFLFENDTKEAHFSIALDGDGTAPPVATGVVRLVAGDFGGPAGTPLTFSVALPIQGKPTITKPTAP